MPSNISGNEEPVMDPDAGMLAKECTKLGGFATQTPLAGIVGLTSCNLLLNPKPLQLNSKVTGMLS